MQHGAKNSRNNGYANDTFGRNGKLIKKKKLCDIKQKSVK